MALHIYIGHHDIVRVHYIYSVHMSIDGNCHQRNLVYKSKYLHGNNHLHHNDLDSL